MMVSKHNTEMENKMNKGKLVKDAVTSIYVKNGGNPVYANDIASATGLSLAEASKTAGKLVEVGGLIPENGGYAPAIVQL